ncbi:MAG TPA: GTP-binding protein [Acidothermaceae bacterium]|nr:GTP-binding protein [Acidothermaceae bacterium]
MTSAVDFESAAARLDRDVELLRFATAGSVDDGKSTLVGRLLHDSKSVLADTLEAVERASRDRGAEGVELALLTDGLRAEREQGITIDVAYRYFTTPRRKFILADTPGHVQYTRNMVTGASTAELVVLLVDARKGVVEQTRRHLAVAALLGVRHLVLAVNKMDLVDFSESAYRAIADDFAAAAEALGISDHVVIPVSASLGDNVVDASSNTPWYDGPTLLDHLETVPVGVDAVTQAARFPVQYVVRAADYRGYAGQLASGVIERDDEVVIMPAGLRTRIVAIDTFDGEVDIAHAPQSVTLRLADEFDVGRGDLIVHPRQEPRVAREFDATVCQLSERSLRAGDRVLIKHTTRVVKGVVDSITHRLDIETLDRAAADALALNEIGGVSLRVAAPLAVDDYATDRLTGSFLVIDEHDGQTLAAGLVGDPLAAGRPQ